MTAPALSAEIALAVRHLLEVLGHLCTKGVIARTLALPIEVREGDSVALYRVAFAFARHGFGDLHLIIDTLNSFVS